MKPCVLSFCGPLAPASLPFRRRLRRRQGSHAVFGQNQGAHSAASRWSAMFGTGGTVSLADRRVTSTTGGARPRHRWFGRCLGIGRTRGGCGDRRRDRRRDRCCARRNVADELPSKCRLSGRAPVCDVSNGLCRDCNSNAQCPPTEECVSGSCVLVKCTNSVSCTGNAGGGRFAIKAVSMQRRRGLPTQEVCSNHRC